MISQYLKEIYKRFWKKGTFVKLFSNYMMLYFCRMIKSLTHSTVLTDQLAESALPQRVFEEWFWWPPLMLLSMCMTAVLVYWSECWRVTLELPSPCRYDRSSLCCEVYRTTWRLKPLSQPVIVLVCKIKSLISKDFIYKKVLWHNPFQEMKLDIHKMVVDLKKPILIRSDKILL